VGAACNHRQGEAKDRGLNSPMKVTLTLSPFVSEALSREAERQRVTVEELINYAAVYYLADLDSGRVSSARPPLDEDQEGASASSG